MALPDAMRHVNKQVTNKVLIHLGGHGSFVKVEHVGRRSGTVRETPVNGFRQGDTFLLALPYGPGTDWMRNLQAAGGGRLFVKGAWVEIGPPRSLARDEGLSRMPYLPRSILSLLQVADFAEVPVVTPNGGGTAPG